jgi:hypothetical protein
MLEARKHRRDELAGDMYKGPVSYYESLKSNLVVSKTDKTLNYENVCTHYFKSLWIRASAKCKYVTLIHARHRPEWYTMKQGTVDIFRLL